MKLFKILILIVILIPLVNASVLSDITFSVNKTDYYFKTGENAIIPLNIENTYGKQIDGLLTYSYTQNIDQAGMHMSSSNSQSTSFSAQPGNSTPRLNFGTSNNPSELDVNLKFVYTYNESRVVNLNGIKIHFISDENQKQTQQNKRSSSSEKNTPSKQTQDPFAQMQQEMNKMMNNNQMVNNNPQNTQKALQNNQMSQDSSALKKQMEEQMEKQKKMKQEFQKQIAKNQEFQKEHQDLLNKGYNLTNANLNPSSNNTGDFKFNYTNKNGKQASLKGHMENGKMQDLKESTPESRQKILNKLQQNKQFQKYQKQLEKQGYSQKNTEINRTNVKVNYANKNNETANITADIINNTAKNVMLQKENKKNYWWILLVLLLIAITLLGYLFKRKKSKPVVDTVKKQEKTFDYKAESIKLIKTAKKLFEQKRFKDAYGTVGQAVRLFLSYENHLNIEITNDEIINYLRDHKKEYKKVKECFDLCSLVEFAKYQANKKDFDKIINYAEKIIE